MRMKFPIGPVSDSDTTGNEVSEFATGGEYSGVTAFADDPDVTDVVSYEITGGDDRFEIDPDTGEIFVKDWLQRSMQRRSNPLMWR